MINALCVIFLPLLFMGLISKVKAIMVGRKGKPILQSSWDFWKLLRKDEIYSNHATQISRFAPLLALAVTFVAAMFVPFLSNNTLLSFRGDYILIVYLLSLAKGIMALAAMDSGSSFQGMGTSRELSFTAFLEPAFFLVVAALIFSSGAGSTAESFAQQSIFHSSIWATLAAASLAIALFIMLLVESSRVPFDDPATHLELTMIHEVMILDFSGFNLAVIHYTAALKMFIYASLISRLILPPQIAVWWYLALMLAIYVLVGVLESLMARFRMNRNLELVLLPLCIALLSLAMRLARYMGAW
ncbi:MAG: NADH-quinone oxidoreductase subunit H [Candidatus Cloacimonetes bacterium]|nr:NADH-quinone oxidoreductase subunit H [Candidatus Cloacimonadota bacterium]MDD2507330.1 NADH-quinone oxidoreductase subunit H [Candidatus Cloacimonadota bacterium]MDD4147440.1 NADH-quinone oxidoreductase subunit H [Candidatus Cloacimonadota bacterium]MDD4560751.1 NADH-quinone oxidoreductase subunit H [Candidatus Cloacimonadota bacterium]